MSKDKFDRHAALARLDMDQLWQLCGHDGHASAEFGEDVRAALDRYRPGPDPKFRLNAEDRKGRYRRLTKALDALRIEIEAMHPQLVWELESAGIDFEPDEFMKTSVGTRHEGLAYGEYVLDGLAESVARLADIVPAAMDQTKASRGRPKQNAGLEQVITALARTYEKHTGKRPLEGYRQDGLDVSQPYKGPFFDFLSAVLWRFNGREFPSGHAIGDAARRAFGLRK